MQARTYTVITQKTFNKKMKIEAQYFTSMQVFIFATPTQFHLYHFAPL